MRHSIATSDVNHPLADYSKQSAYDSLLALVTSDVGITYIEENYGLDPDGGSRAPNGKNEGRHRLYI